MLVFYPYTPFTIVLDIQYDLAPSEFLVVKIISESTWRCLIHTKSISRIFIADKILVPLSIVIFVERKFCVDQFLIRSNYIKKSSINVCLTRVWCKEQNLPYCFIILEACWYRHILYMIFEENLFCIRIMTSIHDSICQMSIKGGSCLDYVLIIIEKLGIKIESIFTYGNLLSMAIEL